MKPLYNHDSIETAYYVDSYPYGSSRCRIRFWLEKKNKKGFRFCSQTEHPYKLIWNAPKKSTYCLLAGCMYLDDNEHCVWSGLTEYSKPEEVKSFIQKFPEADTSFLLTWCQQKMIYSKLRLEGKAKFTINGVVQPDSPTELQQLENDFKIWEECANYLKKLIKL